LSQTAANSIWLAAALLLSLPGFAWLAARL
jgi:hypothetical protein